METSTNANSIIKFLEVDTQIQEVVFTPKNFLISKFNQYHRDWYKLNVYQRIHLNYIEGMSLAQVSLLSSAIYKPKIAALLGVLYVVGRAMYSYFYKKKRGAMNKGRIAGITACMLAIVVNTIIFLSNVIKQMKS